MTGSYLCCAARAGGGAARKSQQFPERFDQRPVRRKPVHGIQGLFCEPPGRLMLPERQMAAFDPAEEAVHGEMEGGIVVFHRGDQRGWRCCRGSRYRDQLDLRIQLFPDLPDDGMLRRLAGFDLAAGKFPAVLVITVPALGGVDPVSVSDDCSRCREKSTGIVVRPSK